MRNYLYNTSSQHTSQVWRETSSLNRASVTACYNCTWEHHPVHCDSCATLYILHSFHQSPLVIFAQLRFQNILQIFPYFSSNPETLYLSWKSLDNWFGLTRHDKLTKEALLSKEFWCVKIRWPTALFRFESRYCEPHTHPLHCKSPYQTS